MAIDPLLVTTVKASELPPAALTPESILVHQIGELLYRTTMQDLLNNASGLITAVQYEIKTIRVPNITYIEDNFDMTAGETQGIGKDTGLWNGWAICNGNNGTDNLDGYTFIGYGANYPNVGTKLGSENAVVVSHSHSNSKINNANGSGTYLNYDSVGDKEHFGLTATETAGESGIGKNMQPSFVILKIMKL